MSDLPSSDRYHHITAMLGYAGSLPFIIGVAVMLNARFYGEGLQSAALFSLYAPYVFIGYSVVILSFLSGALWERSRLADSARSAGAAILFSNAVALSAWLSLLLIYLAPIMSLFAVCLLMAGFLSLLWVERLALRQQAESSSQTSPTQLLSNGYWSMRVRITTLVVLTHIVVAALMLEEL